MNLARCDLPSQSSGALLDPCTSLQRKPSLKTIPWSVKSRRLIHKFEASYFFSLSLFLLSEKNNRSFWDEVVNQNKKKCLSQTEERPSNSLSLFLAHPSKAVCIISSTGIEIFKESCQEHTSKGLKVRLQMIKN